jgi:hypothetical protein
MIFSKKKGTRRYRDRIFDMCSIVQVGSNPKCGKPDGILPHGQEKIRKGASRSRNLTRFQRSRGLVIFSGRPGKSMPSAEYMRVVGFFPGAGDGSSGEMAIIRQYDRPGTIVISGFPPTGLEHLLRRCASHVFFFTGGRTVFRAGMGFRLGESAVCVI